MKSFLFALMIISVRCLIASDGYPVNNNINITKYEFSIFISDTSDMIRGEALIRMIHTGPAKVIRLDLTGINDEGKGMVVKDVQLDDHEVRWTHSDNVLLITPDVEKGEGSTSRVTVKYSGIPVDGLIISKSRYGERTFFADNWPDRARNWIPCVDHPSDKAPVDFIVYAPDNYMVVSNGYKVEESMMPDGIKITHWREDVSISTKVMVIGVARFASRLSARAGFTDIWTYVYPEDRENGFNDYSVAVKPFTFYSEVIGPYSYEKLANVESKTIFGGMENAGCIFYSERSVTGKGTAENLMAHEIAHQWFGNSVTERDWHHIWLSEGFATYFTAYYLEQTYGHEKMVSQMEQARSRVIRFIGQNPSPVVDTTITNLMDLLSANSYQRGAWVLYMLRNELGDDVFMNGIRTFYNRYRNQTALTSDLQETMEEISGRDLDKFFYQWLYVADIPDLEFSWSYNSRRNEVSVSVSQEQDGYVFSFPLEIEISAGEESDIETVRMSSAKETFTFRTGSKPDDVKIDPGVKLLYR